MKTQAMLDRILYKLTGLATVDSLFKRIVEDPGQEGIFLKTLRVMNLRIRVDQEDLQRIPKDGPVIVVANHPTGFAEGVALPALIESVRADVYPLAHVFFARWPEVATRMVLVDPQARRNAKSVNANGLLAAEKRLNDGGCLVIFPAAEVARPGNRSLKAQELPWRKGLLRLALRTKATVIPVFVSGQTGYLHRLLSMIHPRLGALMLFREYLKRCNGEIRLRIGHAIPSDLISGPGSSEEVLSRCRNHVMKLAG